MQAATAILAKADMVLLTHLHIDHVGELPGLLKARAVSSRGPIAFKVFGPNGRRGQGSDASFPSTRRFVDLRFGADGDRGCRREFSAPTAIEAIDCPEFQGADPLRIRRDAGHALGEIKRPSDADERSNRWPRDPRAPAWGS